MYHRLLKTPFELEQSFFLLGPRGTGKTSWIQEKMPDALYIDLLETDNFLRLSTHPEHLEQLIKPKYDGWIVIDEVQKIPILLNEVHRLIEKKNHRFVLTGSSARSLKKKGINLLGGRALSFKMFPLTAVELGKDFVLQHSLQSGHLPYVFSKNNQKKIDAYLKAYVQIYLKEEVMQEGLTRNLGAFFRFLETATFSQASVLNMSEISRESSVHRKVVEDYFQILEDLLLADRIPVFSKKAKRKLITHSKFFFFDVGVYRALRPKGPYDKVEEIEGVAFESLVYQELKAINHYMNFQYELFFWKTANGLEVDFVLYGQNGIIAIEVKRSKQVDKRELEALQTFEQDYPGAKLFFFYGGKNREFVGNIQIIPLQEALALLPELLGG